MKTTHKLVLGSLLLASMIWVVGIYAVAVSRREMRHRIEESTAELTRATLDKVDGLVHGCVADWQVFGAAPSVRAALSASNETFAKMPAPMSYLEEQDRQWRQAGAGQTTDLMQTVQNSELSQALRAHLAALQKAGGHREFGEAFLTNRYGANVGQSDRTSDYRQDDEAWWQETKSAGWRISNVGYDDSAGVYSVDICVRIEDDQGQFLGVLKSVLKIDGIIATLREACTDEDDGESELARDNPEQVDHDLYLLRQDGQVLFASRWPDLKPGSNKHYPGDLPDIAGRAVRVFEWHDPERGDILAACASADGHAENDKLPWLLVMEHDLDHILAPVTQLRNGILLTAAGVTVAGLAMALLTSVSLVRGLNKLRGAATAAGQGDYSRRLNLRRSDELGQVATALDTMSDKLQASRRQAEEEDWVKTGRMKLNEALRGEQGVDELLRGAITSVCRHVEAQVGAIYLANGDGRLHLRSTHAYRTRKHGTHDFAPGEGLVGQAALEGESILLTDVPEDFVPVQSGLGQATPRNVLVMPFARNGSVTGVVELATLKEIGDLEREFLDQAADDLAVAVQSTQSHQHVQDLLERTQAQAEELQTQQEELRQANEELEAQAKALRQSEERLRVQQEELEETNQELEERSEALERERNMVRGKNEELEAARQMVELKASELELTSRYKSEFLANMSHELRTPLNSMLILGKLLADNTDGNLTDKQVEFARTVHHSGRDLLHLINEILDLSKIESGKIDLVVEAVELSAFLGEMDRQFGPIARDKGLAFRTELSPEATSRIATDPQRLGQITRNLLSNALKFTREGHVTVTVAPPTRRDCERLEIGAPSGAVALVVEDTGIGIAADKQELIFDAFQQAEGTTDRKYGGTGLGLSISRELARLLGGAIFVDSTEGKGSRFTVVLPARPPGHEAPAPAPRGAADAPPMAPAESQRDSGSAPAPAAPGRDTEALPDDRKEIAPGDRSLLVIEDDPAFARLLTDLAREKGFKCLVAGNGQTGLHLADHYEPSAILLDLGLPGVDGLTVLSRLKEGLATRHIPVHVISGREADMDALRLGALGFLQKPVSMDRIHNVFVKIENLIDRPLRQLLVVEDNDQARESIVALLDGEDVAITPVGTGREALEQLEARDFDCMVLDLALPDMQGGQLLESIRRRDDLAHVPVIVFTGKELSEAEKATLDRYAERIILKGARSPERLLDETALFLHQVERDLPEEKRRVIRMLHDKDAILRGKTVLLTDDDMRNVFALSSVLEERGLKVDVAKNGRECVDRLENNGHVDLVLMDIMMPEMDGYEAMRRIRSESRFAQLPIIALTAKAMKGDRGRCIEAGASDYLAKPVDTDKLLSMMRVWLYQ